MGKMEPVDTIDLSTIKEILSRRTDNFLLEAKLNPAIIYTKRGTVIPVHHMRKIQTPFGRIIYVVGIEPAHKLVNRSLYRFIHRLREFYSPPMRTPIVNNRPEYNQIGQGDGIWSDPDQNGHYRANYHYEIYQKFKTILTINPHNIDKIESPQTD